MVRPTRRLDPPRITAQLRLVRASDTDHNLRTRRQVQAILALLQLPGGERR